jgi:hypothetical protein
MLSTTTLFEHIRQKCDAQGWQPDEMQYHALHSQHYPPATEQQLLAAETALGFSLPPSLRTLYTQVANGGFGPGFGIVGVLGGFASTGLGGTIVDAYHALNVEISLVDYRQYKQESGKHLIFELPLTDWDSSLLPLCDWGCLNTSFMDIRTDQVLRGAPISRTTYVLRLQASSLQEWLELWLRDAL